MNSTWVGSDVLYIIKQLKQIGMDVYRETQQNISYNTIKGLKPAKDKIEEALKVVCETQKLALAQVWNAYEDKNHVPLSSSSLKNPPKKAIKLGGYLHAARIYGHFATYYDFCDLMPEGIGSELALKTLKDYKPHYIFKLPNDIIIRWETINSKSGAFAICLRSNKTGDFDYVFEFTWIDHQKEKYVTLLEGILLTLKGCLPGLKFASGAEFGDELNVIDAQKKSADSETSNIKIFQGKRSTPLPKELEKGAALADAIIVIGAEKSETDNFTAFQEKTSPSMPKEMEKGAEFCDEFNVTDTEKYRNSETSNFMNLQGKTSSSLQKELEKGNKPNEVKCNTAITKFPPEAIEKQFGETMKAAAENFVSLSTLKHKSKPLDVPGWPGPPKLGKRRENSSPVIQINTNEEVDNEAIHEASTVNRDEHTLTIKAEYKGDKIKFYLPISQATFETVEKEISRRFDMSVGSYKLKYRDDEDDEEDWILLASDDDMRICIKSSRKSDRIVIQLRVQPLHIPSG